MNTNRKPDLIETDRGKEFYNSIFQIFLNKKHIKHCSRNTSLGAVFAERFIKSIRNPMKKPVFERSDAKWVDILPTITKQYNNEVHSSTEKKHQYKLLLKKRRVCLT